MAIMSAIGIGLAGVQTASSIFGGNKKKKEAKKQAKKQQELAEKQFSFNLGALKEAYMNNAENNYSNIAMQMSSLTKEFTKLSSQASFNATVLSGGASYSSNKSDTKNAINSEYKEQMFNMVNLRDYQDITLRKDLYTSAEQLQLDREAQIYGTKSTLSNTIMKANQEQMSGVLQGATSIFNTVSNMPSKAQALPQDKK